MFTPEDCHLCEKILITFETHKPADSLLELPNTFDIETDKFIWKDYGPMGYALIPRTIKGKHAEVDFLICIDEDDLDDIDLQTYAEQFIKKEILSMWTNVAEAHFSEAILSPHENIECNREEHFKK